jgi:hypothetical protein
MSMARGISHLCGQPPIRISMFVDYFHDTLGDEAAVINYYLCN